MESELKLNRRKFLAGSAVSSAALMLGMKRQVKADETNHCRWLKALVVRETTEEAMAKIKAAGFDGIEVVKPTSAQAEGIRKAAEKTGLCVHSVMYGWASFNSADFAKVETTLKEVIDSLTAAQILGADNVLLVPGRINIKPYPKACEFQIKFDKMTGYLMSVTDTNNELYADYITEHNRSYDAFQAGILKLIATAEKTGVVITVENVWNNMFVNAEHMAYFIDSFKSSWVKAYFDIGNHVKYSAPQDWIDTLGKRIVKYHVKDFKLNADGRGGSFVNIRDGSVNWPIVMKALKRIGYKGWMTIEGSDKLTLQERNARLDLILEGR
jgi:hexulose-6-phosphate isomerase